MRFCGINKVCRLRLIETNSSFLRYRQGMPVKALCRPTRGFCGIDMVCRLRLHPDRTERQKIRELDLKLQTIGEKRLIKTSSTKNPP